MPLRTLLLVLLASVSVSSPAKDLVATIRQEAQNSADALLKGNYERVVAYTHKRVVAMIGGKEIMIAKWKRGMGADGFGYVDVIIGTPSEPRKIGSWLTSMVPQHLVAKVSGGRFSQDSVLLGISEDQGKSWVFIDLGSFSKELLAKMFPELDGKIQLPEKKAPVFQKE